MTLDQDPFRRLSRFRRRLSRRALAPRDRDRLLALAVSLLAGIAVFAIASRVFPYHSANDDEAVYLLQAAMLLEGQLEIHAGNLAEAFRPWFFVDDGGRLYPKYNPVPAAMYAVSMALFGEPRVTLAAVAAGNAALVYVLGATIFDRRVGVVAAACFAASPLALLTSSVFLPYAPTTFLNLLFAVSYLRGVRNERLASAGAAGLAIGLAFFARPFTAVLFAAPFVVHALLSVGGAVRREGAWQVWRWPHLEPVRRNALTAAGGLAFVGLALAYNARLTGSPLTFPYEAFAPLDGPGFGYREIGAYSREYTLDLALEANGYVLWYYATRWFTAGPVGTVAALCGLALALRRWLPGKTGIADGGRPADGSGPADGDGGATTDDGHGRTAGLILAGTLLTVPLGNLAFWGNVNVLATMDDPTNGLLSHFGPFYHFDALAPLSIFAGFALVAGWRRLRAGRLHDRLAARTSSAVARRVALAVLVSSALLIGGVNAAVVSAPLERNVAHTGKLDVAYEPFEETEFDDALVFLPTPYGEWQGHPFQFLRNDPGLDGEVVYALDGDPERDFAVIDAYPERRYYRYAYHGDWTPSPDDRVAPTLEELEVRGAERFDGETSVGVLSRVDRATVRLETDAGRHASYATYDVVEPGSEITVDWTLEGGRAELSAVSADADDASESTESDDSTASDDAPDDSSARIENGTIPLEETDEVALSVTLVQTDGSSLTYRQETTVRTTEDGVEVVWPPERTVCTFVTRCGTEGTYIPSEPDRYFDGVSFETRLQKQDS